MSIELRETTDIDLINSIIKNEFVRGDISDDKTKDFLFNSLPDNMTFHAVFNNEKCLGFYATHLQNSYTVEIHTTLLPSCRGKLAIESGKLIIQKLFNSYEKIISYIHEDNKKAMLYSMLMGFKIEGINRKSIVKNGILSDQFLVGITKGEYNGCC